MIDGLKDRHRAAIIAAIAANPRVERAVLFGSRAMGAYTTDSDVDIALFGDGLTLTDQARLGAIIDDIPMAQSVDLILYRFIDNPALLDHIRAHGVVWHRRRGSEKTDRLHLLPRCRRTLEALLRKHLPGVEVWAYGSRVNGRSHDDSDLDLVLRSPGLVKIDPSQLAEFNEAVQESTVPFLVEARDWARLPESFQREIEREHVVLVGEKKSVVSGDWPMVALGEFAPFSYGKGLRRDIRNPTGHIPVFGSNGHVDWHDKALTDGPTVIIGRKGTVGAIHYSPVPCWPIDTTFFISGDNAELMRFKYYALGTLGLGAMNTDSAVPGLNRDASHARKLRVPPLPEQRAIAHILGALDDKIELNRRMNETLEAMARALFKSWFVDFDPVRAKAALRPAKRTSSPPKVSDGTGKGDWPAERARAYLDRMDPEIAALFPDRFVDSGLGEIPEGWLVRTLRELCHKPQYGYTASARSEPVGPRFLRITDINKESWVSWSLVPYCEATDDEFSKYRLRKGDVLIARMADPGHGILVEEDVEAVFASYLIRFRPIENRDARLLQYWLKSDAYWQLVKGQAAGTTRVSLNAKVLGLFPLVVPPNGVASAFAKVVDALRDLLVQSATEMQLLGAIRDALLPKLVSGEVRMGNSSHQ